MGRYGLAEIMGYIGQKNAVPILMRWLLNLECCDYDYVGIAVLSDSLQIYKSVNDINFTLRNTDLKDLQGNAAIAHIHRAMHSRVSPANMHPHIDCKRKVAIVHNGIISNYRMLKERLVDQGHVFTSSTDSEVIAHLIEEKMKSNMGFVHACHEVAAEIEGWYSILAISAEAKRMVAFRREQPLAVAMADRGFIFASSEPAMRDWSRKIVCIQNNSMAVACMNRVLMHNL